MAVSPPCAKLRMLFEFYKVDYQCWKGKRKGSEYKKVPTTVINGLQINDSFIVVKSLARILDGKPLTPELVQLEEMGTYGVMIALEVAVANDSNEFSKCGPLIGMPCLVSCFSCCIPTCAGRSMAKKNSHLLTLKEYKDKYAEALKGKQYFHGDKAGVVDVSLCGILAPFDTAGIKYVTELVGSDGPVAEWYQRMKAQLPKLAFDSSIERKQ